MTGYRLVATDLDGTLLHSDDTLSVRSRLALKAVLASGAHHVIVTGRPVSTARVVFDALGYEGLAVCAQGGQVYDAGRHRLLTSTELDRDVLREVLDRVSAELGPLEVAAAPTGLDGVILTPPGFPWPWATESRRITADGEMWEGPLLKAFILHHALDVDRLAAAAREIAGGALGFVNGGGIVEIVPAGLSKATGLAQVAELVAVPAAEAVSFGDMPADIPMLAWTAHGVAVANAHPEVLAAADEIAPSNNEDGVAVVLERMFDSGP